MLFLRLGRYPIGACAAIVMLAGCGGVQSFAKVAPQAASAGIRPSTGPHLYVADSGTGAIYRYAMVHGLPQTSPEEMFARVPGVHRIGVDSKGIIYAAGGTSQAGFVQKFSANGQSLGYFELNVAVDAFAVDAGGYMYVDPCCYGPHVLTYSPAAFREKSPKPTATLTALGGSGSDQVLFLATDSQGRLYDADFYVLDIFDHPRKTSNQSASISPPHAPWNPSFLGALAFSNSDRLYANVSSVDYCGGKHCHPYYWLLTDFDRISNWLQPSRSDRLIRAKDCRTYSGAPPGYIAGTVTGMAVYDGYIDAACTGDQTKVWVYRASDFKRQHPVEELTGVVSPADVKVGP